MMGREAVQAGWIAIACTDSPERRYGPRGRGPPAPLAEQAWKRASLSLRRHAHDFEERSFAGAGDGAFARLSQRALRGATPAPRAREHG